MKLFTKAQIKNWDLITQKRQSVTSLQLMERAAEKAALFLLDNYSGALFQIVCGRGNNGGDGLAIARFLNQKGQKIRLYLIQMGSPSKEYSENLQFLLDSHFPQITISEPENFILEPQGVIVDCLVGSGFKNPLPELANTVIQKINQSGLVIISIDIPSGVSPDLEDQDDFFNIPNQDTNSISNKIFTDNGNPFVHNYPSYNGNSTHNNKILARITLNFEIPKLSSLIPEIGKYYGQWKCLDIFLDEEYEKNQPSPYFFTTQKDVVSILQPRGKFQYKGDFGHSLLLVGSYGLAGAAYFSSSAAVSSGSGLVSTLSPEINSAILQTLAPEAMFLPGAGCQILESIPSINLERFTAIGLGPGLGTAASTEKSVISFIKNLKIPLVLDADGINIISKTKNWKTWIPAGTILTPHVGEFNRLMGGGSKNPIERLKMGVELAAEISCVIVLKGAYSAIILPTGHVHFNSTGNPGMATGGSGDVLTGILTGLLAQSYSPANAAILGVYIHGSAGDLAKQVKGEMGLKARDLLGNIGNAFKELEDLKSASLLPASILDPKNHY